MFVLANSQTVNKNVAFTYDTPRTVSLGCFLDYMFVLANSQMANKNVAFTSDTRDGISRVFPGLYVCAGQQSNG